MQVTFADTQSVNASCDATWAYFSDVSKIAGCIPGIQEVEAVGPDQWRARLLMGLGMFKLKLSLDVTRPEMVPQEYMTLTVRGRAPGNTVEVLGRLRFEAVAPEQTRLHWQAEVTVSGLLANVGRHMLQAAGEREIANYFACVQKRLEQA